MHIIPHLLYGAQQVSALVLLMLTALSLGDDPTDVRSLRTPTPGAAEDSGVLDDRGLRRYRRSAHLAVDAIRRRQVQRVTAFVCWGREDAFLYRLLSSAGMATQFLRGTESTRVAFVKLALGDNVHRAAVIVDAACPSAHRVLTLASRLRLFHISNSWVIFENGLLADTEKGIIVEDAFANATTPDGVAYPDGEFDDLHTIPVHRFGAQDRDSAVDPNEAAFLEMTPPTPPRVRTAMLAPQTDRLSRTAHLVLDHRVMFVDSHVLWVQATGQAYLVAMSPTEATDDGGAFRWLWTIDGHLEAALRERRSDLQGATLRGSTIIKFPHEYTHIEDNNLRQNDLYPKMNWPVTQNLAYSLNFGMLVYKRDNYGWDDGRGVFDGMMGEMQRYKHDMLATAVFIRADRLPIIDQAAETFHMRTAVLFRQPSKSSVSNVYVLPFSPRVWQATVAVSLLAVVLLAVQTQWWRRHPHAVRPGRADAGDHLDIADCVFFIVGALSQQGFYCTPAMVSARITFITTFIANLFLFTSFSGSIVAIIQSPSDALRSVRDIINSDMLMAVQEIRFQHVWFREAESDPTDVAYEVFKKKIRTHERPGYLSTQEGIKKVRHGMHAFQVETNEGYREILDTFTESEKCDLSELELFPAAPMVFCTTEKSPYREAVSRK